MEFYRRNYVEGLFLSSGVVHSTQRTMQQLLETLEILRFRYKFSGYVHLKILPGTGEAETERAVALANRVSLNMEAPSALHLARLSNTKNYAVEIMGGMSRIHRYLRNQPNVSHSTQFIVGAAQESDSDILDSTVRLYADYGLKRAYFSTFQPVPGTPLDGIAGAPLIREHRLYQADFLYRYYGFRMEELPYDPRGNLDLSTDPKQAYALQHPERFPLEINRASMSELLRIPGIGPRSAKKILMLRRECSFRSIEDLKRIGVVTKRALPFILVQGKKFTPALARTSHHNLRFIQPSLWGDPA
jgi:predicted DNA-binding helix-hairpin-helix protein